MSTKLIWILLIIVGIYLLVSYTGFYGYIGAINLRPPAHAESTTIKGALPEIRYAALGDSLSDGVGVSDYSDSFAYILAKKFGDGKAVELINLAKAGATSYDVISSQLARAVEAKPQITTILVGVNDIHQRTSVQEFERNYQKIVLTMKQTGSTIYCLSIPLLGSEKIVRFPYNLILDWRTRSLNEIIKKVADENGVKFVDLYAVKRTADFYSTDLFHPSAAGYKEWLEAF